MVKLTRTQFGGLDILSPTTTNYDEIEEVLFDILSKGKEIRSAEDAKDYMDELEDDCVMRPIHQNGKPIIIDHEYCALLWDNAEHPNDPDYMAGIIFILIEEDGKSKFKRAGVIVGDAFEGVLQVRNPCCKGNTKEDQESAYSMVIFIEQNEQIRHKILDTPVTKSGCLQMFDKLPKGITVSSHEIAHMLDHHHKGPGHDCGHDHGQLPKLRQ